MPNVFKDSNVIIDDRYVLLEEIRKIKTPASNTRNPEDGIYATNEDVLIKQEQMFSNSALTEAKTQANKIIEDAQTLSKKIHENAMQKAKQELEKAHEEGYKEGIKQGKAFAQQQLKATINEFIDFVNLIENEKQDLLLKYEEDLKDLALSIAKKIIDIELNKNDEAFLNLFKNALMYLNKQDTLRLSVSELDKEFVTTNKDILLSLTKGAKNIEIAEIDGAPKGVCILETEQSLVDASVDSQLDKIKQMLNSQM